MADGLVEGQATHFATFGPMSKNNHKNGVAKTWEHGMYAHCKLNMTFQDLRDEHKERSKANLHIKYRTGGLGLLMQQNLFEVWLCLEEHNCSHPNGNWFCWVIDESVAFPDERAPDQYIAWGYNSDLKLF